jgi:hypothetical protein
MATVNWAEMDEAAEEAIKPAPAGTYTIELKSAQDAESTDKKPQVRFNFKIVDGPYKGKTVFHTITFNDEKPNTIVMAREFLATLGFKNLKEWGSTDPKQRLEMVVGRRIEAEVQVNEWKGRQSNRVGRVLRGLASGPNTVPGGIAPPPLSTGEAPAAPVNPLSV